MKKIFALIACAALVLTSCKDDRFEYGKDKGNTGTLSLSGLTLNVSEEVNPVTKADPADDSYTLFLYDASNALVWEKSYGEIKGSSEGISLAAGEYTLSVRSTSAAVPEAKFSAPVYGTSETFSIAVGQTTSIGTLTCTLLQSAVSVNYNDDFLKMVTGDGSTSVEVSSGYPLEYKLSYNNGAPTYDRRIGYFAVNNGERTTMNVVFKGNIDGKSQKMTATLTGIKPQQWRQIKFSKKVDSQGNATFAIVINGYVDDEELTVDLAAAAEDVIGEDPDAPKGDGGITLEFASDCTMFSNLDEIVVPAEGVMDLRLVATVPNGVKKFVVNIASSSAAFVGAVDAAGGSQLDLVNPSPESEIVFQIVPFPHGADMLGQTAMSLNLSASQEAILNFAGTHTFTMVVTDNKGCKNSIPVTMVVR